MNALFVITACALLCALACMWLFRPLRTPVRFYAASFGCAALTLVLYLALGNPELPAQPVHPDRQTAQDLQKEAEFMALLDKNPDDADILIRLAALRVLQGRIGTDTTALLDRAATLKPGDRRIGFIRAAINHPLPDTP